MTKTLRIKLHTGPTQVDAIADRLEGLSRIRVTCRGTEHVYVDVIADHIDTARDLLADGAHLPWLGSSVVSWAVSTKEETR